MSHAGKLRQTLRGALVAAVVAFATACATPPPPPEAQRVMQTELFLFIYRPGASWRDGVPMSQQEGMRAHGAYMLQLLSEGRLVAGGGFHDTATEGGMAIVRAGGMEEAQSILGADPAITSGTFTADLRHWRSRFGGVGAP